MKMRVIAEPKVNEKDRRMIPSKDPSQSLNRTDTYVVYELKEWIDAVVQLWMARSITGTVTGHSGYHSNWIALCFSVYQIILNFPQLQTFGRWLHILCKIQGRESFIINCCWNQKKFQLPRRMSCKLDEGFVLHWLLGATALLMMPYFDYNMREVSVLQPSAFDPLNTLSCM